MMRPLVLIVGLMAPTMAWAQSHAVTVRNGTGETIRGIGIAPTGAASFGDNRLRSQLPPGSEGRFGYSTGCAADVRITFESGRTEDHRGLDTCSDPRIVAGQEGVAGPAGSPITASSKMATPATQASVTPSGTPVRAPPPVPPWTGKSITKRFGGMD